MSKQLNIYSGNVSCSAGNKRYARNTKLVPIISDIFLDDTISNLDIILLNEFYKYDDYSQFELEFKNRDYEVLIDDSDEINYNEVFIAISKKSKLKIIYTEYSEKNLERKGPDYNLTIVEDTNDIKIAIIGTRIRSSRTAQYEENAEEFIELLELINKLKTDGISNFIMAGDFNHGRLLVGKDKNLTLSEIESVYKGYAQLPHNYHLIKNKINEIGLILCTPEGFSYPINKARKSLLKIPNDHLIISKNWNVEIIKYEKDTKYSDHKALVATINE